MTAHGYQPQPGLGPGTPPSQGSLGRRPSNVHRDTASEVDLMRNRVAALEYVLAEHRAELTRGEVLYALQEAVAQAGSAAAFARSAGVSQQYVGDVLAGRRAVAGKLLSALGLEKVVRYRERRAA